MFVIQQQETTVTIKEYCAQNKVSRTTLYRLIWKKKVRTKQLTPRGRVEIIVR